MTPNTYWGTFRRLSRLLKICNNCGRSHIVQLMRKYSIAANNCDNLSSVPEAKLTKEIPEEPTTCCMSGCANCVWLDYAEKLSAYMCDSGEKALEVINEKISDPNIKTFLLHELRAVQIYRIICQSLCSAMKPLTDRGVGFSYCL